MWRNKMNESSMAVRQTCEETNHLLLTREGGAAGVDCRLFKAGAMGTRGFKSWMSARRFEGLAYVAQTIALDIVEAANGCLSTEITPTTMFIKLG